MEKTKKKKKKIDFSKDKKYKEFLEEIKKLVRDYKKKTTIIKGRPQIKLRNF